MSSIEHDSRYKRTWGIGGGDTEGDSNGKVVSRQPSGVRNGQAAQVNAPAPTGPYIKRWGLGHLSFTILLLFFYKLVNVEITCILDK